MNAPLPLDATADPAVTRLLAQPPYVGRVIVQGALPPARPRVAVVGTRRPTAEQRDRATAIGAALARSGAVVCSGGAVGIDVAALRGAMAAGGTVIAVLPCHPDAPYPPEHRELYGQIVRSGGVLLCLDERQVRTCFFLRRNRLLAAVAQGLIAVAADLRSGTMMVARAAVAAGDALAVAGWPAGTARTSGTAWLAQIGAPTIADDADLQRWYRGWVQVGQGYDITTKHSEIRAALDSADLRRAPHARPRGQAPAVDVDRPGSPSYAAPGGAAQTTAPPDPPAALPDWPPAQQRVWHLVAQAHPRGQTLEELVAACDGDRRAANAAVLALSMQAHLWVGPDGTWRSRPAGAR
ncbi:MAG: DNA-processing protein DprA [Deltaproteobacteria bacterium]|nr:DNA-processing protein DprA [Deltaproteobacteria bacterium]